MSNYESATIEDIITEATKSAQFAYNVGYVAGCKQEQESIAEMLQNYLDLTLYSEKYEGAEPNPEWDTGFQAALALVKKRINK